MKECLNFYLWVTRLAERLADDKKCRDAVSIVAQ